MKDFNFKRIVEIAEGLIEEKGCDKSSLAKELGLPSRYIADIKAGKSKQPSPSFVLALINKLNFSPLWLETGEGTMFRTEAQPSTSLSKYLKIYTQSDLQEGESFIIPLLSQKLSAGQGAYMPESDEPQAYVPVPKHLARFGKDLAALQVDGDSMYPTLSRGDLVVCDSCGWSGEGIYALRMGGEGFVKRITKELGKVVVISDNPKYLPREISEDSQDFQLIGRVHCAIKQLD